MKRLRSRSGTGYGGGRDAGNQSSSSFDSGDSFADGQSQRQQEAHTENDHSQLNSQNQGNVNDSRSRSKRRSKNDQSGRNFICGCKKKYLSYPALYTHIKQKHGGVTPAGTNTSQLFTGRGRGRPRKTLAQDGNRDREKLEIKEQYEGHPEDYGSEDGLFLNTNGRGPSDSEIGQLMEKVLQELELIKQLKALGGPSNPSEWFSPTFHLQFSLNKMKEIILQTNILSGKPNLNATVKFQMAKQAQEYVESVYPIFYEMAFVQVPDLLAHAGIDLMRPQKQKQFPKGTLFLLNINDDGRNALKIDDVLCLYLIDLSEQVIVNFYKLACCFIQLLRNCINQYAFQVVTGINPVELSSQEQQNLAAFPTNFYTAKDLITLIEGKIKGLFTQKQHRASPSSSGGLADQFGSLSLHHHTVLGSKMMPSMSATGSQLIGNNGVQQTLQNNIDIIPHISNLFLQKYMPQKCNIFEERHAVVLMRHLCSWLAHRKFTSYGLKV